MLGKGIRLHSFPSQGNGTLGARVYQHKYSDGAGKTACLPGVSLYVD